jgi:hypothetical protein
VKDIDKFEMILQADEYEIESQVYLTARPDDPKQMLFLHKISDIKCVPFCLDGRKKEKPKIYPNFSKA